MLKPTVNDPQGNAVWASLKAIGFEHTQSVRVGKYLTIDLEAGDAAAANAQVNEMCDRLLANPVIETYRFEVTQA